MAKDLTLMRSAIRSDGFYKRQIPGFRSKQVANVIGPGRIGQLHAGEF